MDDAAFAANVLLFGRVLRRAGVAVHHARLIDAVRALRLVSIGRREDVHATLRALLIHRHDDFPRFDAAFALFFVEQRTPSAGLPLRALGEAPRVTVRPPARAAVAASIEDMFTADNADSTRDIGAYSAAAVSRHKDFADFSAAELEAAYRLLANLPWRLGSRRTRRWQRGRHVIDPRHLLRRSILRGDVVTLDYRTRRRAPRPIVFIGDVSGSMERYSRILLHFVYGLARHTKHVEAFVFSTRLTRLTRRLVAQRTGVTLTHLLRDVDDWGGGTRIGDSLRSFNTRWSRRIMRHGPVVLLVSDGWDRGDPAVLARELARLRRHCHRLVWLNPLLGSASYEPLTRGMQAALPHIDDFLPVHNLASLDQLAARLLR